MISKLDVLRVRDFRWFFLGSLASLIGDFMAPVALAFAVLSIGGPEDLGLVLAARVLPLVAFMLIGGVIADRLPRRTVMLWADVVRAGSQGVLAVLLLTGSANVWQLVVLQMVHGTASALFMPAVTGLVQQTVPEERLQEANSLTSLARASGNVAGPVLAGLLVAFAGAGWAIAVDAATFALSALCLGFLPRAVVPARLSARAMLDDLREGWREFTARRWVWTIVATASLANMFQAAYAVLGPVVADDQLGGAVGWGLIMASFGAGAVCGGLVTLWLKTRFPLRTGVFAVSLFSAPILALALQLPVPVVALAAFLGGCGLMVFNTLWETTLQSNVPADRLSRVSAYEWLGSMACQPLGMVIIPVVAASTGPQPVLWTCGIAMLVMFLSLMLIRDVREIPSATTAKVQI
ncbi:MFS transporter [Streptomyces sp. NBC_01142]|uniref:MFS transporter n=1 Tax=Streptomyces sp. NBC_01142 TaxID=2975865 RepID=UPI0022582320|nr:MFS transporter [Streptomyces sp. NBC_01142]MCX4820791.1 MFS transporter [Streptomyces sp. NBC_01142]